MQNTSAFNSNLTSVFSTRQHSTLKDIHTDTHLNVSLLHWNTQALQPVLRRTPAAPVWSFVAIKSDTCGIYWSTAGYEMKTAFFYMNIQTTYWARQYRATARLFLLSNKFGGITTMDLMQSTTRVRLHVHNP